MSRDVTKCPHCGGKAEPRTYDKPEAIKMRLDFFANTVMKVIDMYKEKDKLIEVDGELEVGVVFKTIAKSLEPMLKVELPE